MSNIFYSISKLMNESNFIRKYFKKPSLNLDDIDVKKDIEIIKESVINSNAKIEYNKVVAMSSFFLNKEEFHRLAQLFQTIPKQNIKYFNTAFFDLLLSVIGRLKKKFDYLLLVDGYEGSGKSTFASNLAYWYRYIFLDRKLNEQNFVFNLVDFADSLYNFKDEPYEPFHIDEAGTLLFSRDASSKFVKQMIKILEVARARNWFFIVVLPNINFIDIYIRTHRATGWAHVEDRGKTWFMPRNALAKQKLFMEKKVNTDKLLKLMRNKILITYPDFNYDKTVIEEYNKRKRKHIDNTVDDFVSLVNGTNGEDLASVNRESLNSLCFGTYPLIIPQNFVFGYTSKMNKFAHIDGAITKVVSNPYELGHKKDELAKTIYGSDDEWHNEATKIKILQMNASYHAISNLRLAQKRNVLYTGSPKHIMYAFDLYRSTISGLATQSAMKKSVEYNDTPSLFWFYYLLSASQYLNLPNLLETAHFLHSPIPSSISRQISTMMLTEKQNYEFTNKSHILKQYIYPNTNMNDILGLNRFVFNATIDWSIFNFMAVLLRGNDNSEQIKNAVLLPFKIIFWNNYASGKRDALKLLGNGEFYSNMFNEWSNRHNQLIDDNTKTTIFETLFDENITRFDDIPMSMNYVEKWINGLKNIERNKIFLKQLISTISAMIYEYLPEGKNSLTPINQIRFTHKLQRGILINILEEYKEILKVMLEKALNLEREAKQKLENEIKKQNKVMYNVIKENSKYEPKSKDVNEVIQLLKDIEQVVNDADELYLNKNEEVE